jgi:hypothetical protein
MVESQPSKLLVAGSSPVSRSTGVKMDTRDMLQYQVDQLTSQCQKLVMQVEEMESRISYFEKVVLTLLIALKEGGVIVDSESGQYEV